MNEQIGELRKSETSVTSRVFDPEKVANVKSEVPEVENNLHGVSDILDQVNTQVKLYPSLKDAKKKGYKAYLVRDRLFINGSVHSENPTTSAIRKNRNGYREALLSTSPKEQDRPYKRFRKYYSSQSLV